MGKKSGATIVEKPKYELVKLGPVQATINELVRKFDNIVYDVTTTRGMATATADRAELRGARCKLEQARKEEKADILERGRYIDSTAKSVEEVIRKYEEPLDTLIKDEQGRKEREKLEKQEIEKKRVFGLLEKIASIRKWAGSCGSWNSATISHAIEEVQALTIDAEHFQEYVTDAQVAKDDTLAAMGVALAGAVAQEAESKRIIAERAELEELRARATAQQKIIDEQNAAEQRRLAEEKAAQDALIAEENDRIIAERRAHEEKMAAEQAEIDRVAAEAEAQRAAEQAERDRVAAAEEADRNRLAELERQTREAEAKKQAVIAEAAAKEADKKAKLAERERKLAFAKCENASTAFKNILVIIKSDKLSADEMLAAIELIAAANV
jgi:hypothetical protein